MLHDFLSLLGSGLPLDQEYDSAGDFVAEYDVQPSDTTIGSIKLKHTSSTSIGT